MSSIISPVQTSEQVAARIEHLKSSLYKNFQCLVESDMILQQVEILVAEKINDFIYQYLKDWNVPNLVDAGHLLQAEVTPEEDHSSASMKEEPKKKSRGKKAQESLN